MFRRHYSDEQLLAHLDGELTGWTRARLESHLLSCWGCRARRAELEQQIHDVVSAFQEPNFPGDGWIDCQVSRFRVWEATQAPPQPVSSLRSAFPFRWAAATAALVIVAGVVFWARSRNADPEVQAVIAQAKLFEAASFRQAVHQRFEIHLSRTRGTKSLESGHVEVWSDPVRRRYAARWDSNGALAFAAWRPREGEEYVHGVPEGGPVRLTEVVAGPEGWDEMHSRFRRWLAGHEWKPISITDDISKFISQSGVTLRAERVRSSSGEERVRITAQRGEATLIADFAARDFSPRLYQLQTRRGASMAEIRMSTASMERGAQITFRPAVFEPDAQFARRPPATVPLPSPPLEPASAIISALERQERQVEVQLALHRADVCLGDPFRISVLLDGTAVVEGLVADDDRRAAVQQAFAELQYVQLRIRTLPEAVAVSGSPEVNPLDHSAPEVVRSQTPLIQKQLVEHFRQHVPQAQVTRRIASLSTQATEATAEVLAHAWAVRRLLETFPEDRIRQFRPRSRWVLEDILHDHLNALRTKASAALSLLTPVLGERSPTGAPSSADSDLRMAIAEVFRHAEETDRFGRGLFGLTRLAGDEESSAAELLLLHLTQLHDEATTVDNRVTADLRDAAMPADSRTAREQLPKENLTRKKQ